MSGEMVRGQKLAAVTAVTGWASLALQLVILFDMLGVASATWRFLGYFTLLTNLLVAISATRIGMGLRGPLTGPGARLALAASIGLVGIVYWVALAGLWQPQGWALVADVGLHTLQPFLYAALWFVMRDGSLGWREVIVAAGWPLAYALYAMARGAVDGWYAYWFLDPTQQSVIEMIVSIAILLGAVMAIAALLMGIDRAGKSTVTPAS
jgi:hypothetical protein